MALLPQKEEFGPSILSRCVPGESLINQGDINELYKEVKYESYGQNEK